MIYYVLYPSRPDRVAIWWHDFDHHYLLPWQGWLVSPENNKTARNMQKLGINSREKHNSHLSMVLPVLHLEKEAKRMERLTVGGANSIGGEEDEQRWSQVWKEDRKQELSELPAVVLHDSKL